MKTLLVSLSAVSLLITGARAGTIHWGNALGDVIHDSDGNALSAGQLQSEFKFELGTFADGFTPNSSNISLWAVNWRRLASSLYGVGSFGGTVTLNTVSNGGIIDGNPSPTPDPTLWLGKQAYVWIYNNLAMDQTTEWNLVTNGGWNFPGAGDDPRAEPLNFYVSNTDTTALFGREGSDGSTTSGSGIGTPAPPAGLSLQTFTFAPPIPEPSSALLLALSLGWLLGIRRRG